MTRNKHQQNALKRIALLALAMLGVLVALRGMASSFEVDLPSLENAVVLNSGWEYRLGDSPQRSGRPPDWTVSEQSIAWVRAGSLENLQFPKGQNAMWLRVRLPNGNWAGPSLLVENSSALFQVYMGGRLLYPTDTLDRDSRLSSSVLRWHIIPLLVNSSEQYVYLRMIRPRASDPIGRFSLGSRHLHYRSIVNASLWRIALGLLSVLIGVAAFLVSSFRRMEKMTLAFSAMATSAGLYMFLSAPLRLEWANTPFLWSFLEYGALYLTPPAFYWFLREFVDVRHKNALNICSRAHLGFAFIAQLVALSGFVSYRTLLIGFFVCSAGAIAFVCKTLFRSYRTIHSELRAPFAAIVFLFMSSLWEMVSWSLSTREISPWPGMFVTSLSLVVCAVGFAILRVAIKHERNLQRVNGLLERSVGAAVELSGSSTMMAAVSKTAEALVRELRVEAICNVHLYLRQNERALEAPLYHQAMLVSQGRLVNNPTMGPLRQKFEAMAEQLNAASAPYVNAKHTLIVPMNVGGKKWGFFTVDNYKYETMHSDDDILLRVLCETLSHTILALDLRDHSVVEAKLESELQITSALQKFLIPDSIQIPNAQVASKYRAADITGGDWFGYHVHANKKSVDVFLGDATSHGMKSALMVAHASGAVQAAISRFTDVAPVSEEDRLTRLARSVNKVIYDVGRDELYMSMLFMNIDLETGIVLYVNAGHPAFYYLDAQNGRAQSVVPAPSQSLGFTKAPTFNVERFELKRGDVLFLSSSGLFDNEGEAGRRFSSRRLKTILEKSRDPQEIQKQVMTAAEGVWKDSVLSDDVTTVVIKWLGSMRTTQDAPISHVDKKAV